MNITLQLVLALLASAAPASDAPAGGWQLGDRVLIFGAPEAPAYKLDCTGPQLVVTNFGVTSLLDIRQNKPVPDNEGDALPEGAAFMALATDKTDPAMIPATAVRNARAGWDMTIRLAKTDRTFLSLPKAKYVSLFTTGFTQMVALGKEDKALVATFVSQCRPG